MRLACLGDVMLARGVSEVLATSPPAELWGDCLPPLSDADLRLANLECCVSDRGSPFQPPRTFEFRAIPKAIEVLKAAEIDVVTLANNHSLDFGEEALVDTLDRLDGAGIAHVGAGRNLKEAMRPAILKRAGLEVAFIAFTDNFPEYGATNDRPGTFYLDTRQSPPTFLLSMIEEASGADLVAVTAHCGPNMVTAPSEHLKSWAHLLADQGAGLWFGHSAHLFHGVEFYKGTPVIYDGGDFLDDYAVDPVLRNDRSLLWILNKSKDGPAEIEAFPVQLEFARTRLARGEEAEWILERLRQLCAEMGTDVTASGNRFLLR